MGLRNARLNFRQLEETHTMENIIFNELKIRDFNVDIGAVVVNGRGKNGAGTAFLNDDRRRFQENHYYERCTSCRIRRNRLREFCLSGVEIWQRSADTTARCAENTNRMKAFRAAAMRFRVPLPFG